MTITTWRSVSKEKASQSFNPDAFQEESDYANRAEADFHPSFVAAPAAFSRLGSAVLIAAVRAAEPDLKEALAVPDAQLAEVSADVEPVDCALVPLALLPVDCLALDDLARAGCSGSAQVDWTDFLARLMAADRCVAGVRGQRSASADLLPVDCLVLDDLALVGCSGSAQVDWADFPPVDYLALDDLARAGCSGSAQVDWTDFLARLMAADRCVAGVRGQRSASADLLPVDCLVLDDLALVGCSGSPQVDWADFPPVDYLALVDLARAGCSESTPVDWADCPVLPRAAGHFAVVLEPVD